jgi:nucleoside-diphosphate-sugar epimerase
MNILVTGGAGYIGSVLVPLLIQNKHSVKVLDRFFFGNPFKGFRSDDQLFHTLNSAITGDVRWVSPDIFRGIDTVIDLAALSNDPSGELNPALTWDINCVGRTRIATLAKHMGVRRYILASTCSVYGFNEEWLNEDSPTNPLTTYSKSNLQAEKNVLALADDNFCVTILRQATLFGLSPRMRFDLVLNQLVLSLFKEGILRISGDGTQWRPFLHVQDTVKAMMLVLNAPKEQVNREIFNVINCNCSINELAAKIAGAVGLPEKYELARIYFGTIDNRSYRIDSTKMWKFFKFKPSFDLSYGAQEIWGALNNGLDSGLRTFTVDWYKTLLEVDRLLIDIKLDGRIL